jgi:hypothetical protein
MLGELRCANVRYEALGSTGTLRVEPWSSEHGWMTHGKRIQAGNKHTGRADPPYTHTTQAA